MDSPHLGLSRPVNGLVVTVRAPAVALAHPDGQIRAEGMDGLFVGDVRALTEVRLRFGGVEPHPLAALAEGPGRTRFVTVVPGFGDPINDPTVRLERVREVLPDGMTEQLIVSSTATRPVRAWITLELRCDLTPLDLARHGGSQADLRPVSGDGGLLWRGAEHSVIASGDGAQVTADPGRLRWTVDLAPGERTTLAWRVAVTDQHPILASPAGAVEWSRPRVRGGDERLHRLLVRALDDLESLRLVETGADERSTFLGAGAPWFLTLFGRDSIWAARMLLPLGTDLAEGTLRTLARRQGSIVDGITGEAPGKIMHELRRHEGRVPTGAVVDGRRPAYYGTVDATLLWISLLADAWRWGLPESVVAELRPHLRRALDWLARYADVDGDGFVEYIDVSGAGLANQGWKDSFDAVRFRDGSLGRPPIALCEVQGYAHRAALDGAALLESLDPNDPQAPRLRAYAAGMADRFRSRFWVDGPLGPYPALAIDADGRPVDSLTSNIGHLLGTGLLTTAEEAQVAQLLRADPLSGGYGLRTMSTLDSGFAPLSYHCGSVWPHDTAIALLGLTTAGGSEPATGDLATAATQAARRLVDGLLRAGEAFDYRLPELYGGDDRTLYGRPLPYPDACQPQAWAAAAAVTILQASLGLRVDVPRGEVRVRPLPGIGALDVDGLRIGGRPVRISVGGSGATHIVGLPSTLRWLPMQRTGLAEDRAPDDVEQ